MTDPSAAASPSWWTSRRKAQVVVLVCVLAGLLLVSQFRDVFLPLGLAWALAYLLDPLVRRMAGPKVSRGFAVGLVFFAFLVLVSASIWWLIGQGLELWVAAVGTQEKPGFLAQVPTKVQTFLEAQAPDWKEEIASVFGDGEAGMRLLGHVRTVVQGLADGFSGLATLFGFFVLVPIYLFYVLLDYQGLLDRGKAWLPASQRERVLEVASRIDEGLSAFLRGRLMIAFARGVFTWIGLLIAGVPYSFAVGMGSGLLGIIPIVGGALGFGVAAILALLEPSWTPFLGVVLIYGIGEVVENYVLTPKILGESVGIGEITTMLSLVFWGALFGFFGVLLAIPLTIVVREVAKAWIIPSFESLARQDSDAGS